MKGRVALKGGDSITKKADEMKNLILILAFILTLAGCSSSNSKPKVWQIPMDQTENAMSEATRFVQSRYRDRNVNRPPVVSYMDGTRILPFGHPAFDRDGNDSIAFTRGLTITVRSDYRHEVLVHECMHVVLKYNKMYDRNDSHPSALNSRKYGWPRF